jgi:hypothetical protein
MIPLDPALGVKPLDFGMNGLTGSIDTDGRLIALNSYHERYGYITLTASDPFPETERYNPTAVRAYRRSLADLAGFGPTFDQPIARREAFLLEQAIPMIRLTFEDGSQAMVTTFADEQGAVQIWRCPHPFRWRGKLSLQRCAYTQLTEGGPVEMPPVQSKVVFENGMLTIENPALGRTVAIAGFPPSQAAWTTDSAANLDLEGHAGILVLRYALGSTPQNARDHLSQENVDIRLARVMKYWRDQKLPVDPLLARGIVYSQRLAVPVGDTTCLLTDHMLLPLSWNRDAYYLALTLLDRKPDIVRRHILWMFETAERYDGAWGRCYLANGTIKDRAFQLDQQIFPLLELADYTLATGDWTLWEHLRDQVPQVLDGLETRQHHRLYPTDETPADDPMAYPYHLSSHVLLWHTLNRLYEVEPQDVWQAQTNAIHDTIMNRFVADYGGFAYAIDDSGRFYLYHDANDVPLALIPAWGFIPADNPIWEATVKFAFSEENKGGIYAGRLGSVHTPAPWPLGDLQEALIARALSDPIREQIALDHLRQAAQWDGALPEAYDAVTGAVVSRHWFAWPNAALVAYHGNAPRI